MMQALPYVAPRSLLKANLAPAYANKDALSEATLTRYRDMMLAPGVRPAILARMGQVILRDPRPNTGRHQDPDAASLGRKGCHDPNQQRGRLLAIHAPRAPGKFAQPRPRPI